MAHIDLATMTETQRKGISEAISTGAVFNVDDNAEKLDATPAFGDIYVVTDEADRVERYIGPDPSLDSSWLVLQNSITLTVENATGDTITVGGVSCLDSEQTFIGWVDPQSVNISDLAGTATVSFVANWDVSTTMTLYGDGDISFPVVSTPRGSWLIYIY